MYIGQYFPGIITYPLEPYELKSAVWDKGKYRPVLLWRQGENNKLVPVYEADQEDPKKIVHKVVLALNSLGIIVYHPEIVRYCTLAKINGEYVVIGINCGG